jgi:hypothetical protein
VRGTTDLVRADVAGVAALGDDAGLGPDGAVGIELVDAVGLVIVLALLALQAGVELGADADALARLDQSDLGPDAQGLANDLVADAEGEALAAPAAADGVDIGAADAAGLDLDLDIVVLEGLGRDLEGGVSISPRFLELSSRVGEKTDFSPMECRPCLGRVDLEAFKSLGIHGKGRIRQCNG